MFDRNVPIRCTDSKHFTFETTVDEAKMLCAKLEKYGCMLMLKVDKPVSPGTEAQNKAMHKLLTEYYKTGMHSAPKGTTLAMFKIIMKAFYGPDPVIEIGLKSIKPLKSWSDYTKHERMEFIDGLISEIKQSGAYDESIEIQKVIDGMDGHA